MELKKIIHSFLHIHYILQIKLHLLCKPVGVYMVKGRVMRQFNSKEKAL